MAGCSAGQPNLRTFDHTCVNIAWRIDHPRCDPKRSLHKDYSVMSRSQGSQPPSRFCMLEATGAARIAPSMRSGSGTPHAERHQHQKTRYRRRRDKNHCEIQKSSRRVPFPLLMLPLFLICNRGRAPASESIQVAAFSQRVCPRASASSNAPSRCRYPRRETRCCECVALFNFKARKLLIPPGQDRPGHVQD